MPSSAPNTASTIGFASQYLSTAISVVSPSTISLLEVLNQYQTQTVSPCTGQPSAAKCLRAPRWRSCLTKRLKVWFRGSKRWPISWPVGQSRGRFLLTHQSLTLINSERQDKPFSLQLQQLQLDLKLNWGFLFFAPRELMG